MESSSEFDFFQSWDRVFGCKCRYRSRGGIAHRPRSFLLSTCIPRKVYTHPEVVSVCMQFKALWTVRIRDNFGGCAKVGILRSGSELYRVYTQNDWFFVRIPNPALGFATRHSNEKVLTEPFSYIRGYPCLHFKESEFHYEAFIEVCFCVWVTELRGVLENTHFVSGWRIYLSAFPLEVAQRCSQRVWWTLLSALCYVSGLHLSIICLCVDGCYLNMHFKGVFICE